MTYKIPTTITLALKHSQLSKNKHFHGFRVSQVRHEDGEYLLVVALLRCACLQELSPVILSDILRNYFIVATQILQDIIAPSIRKNT